MKGQISAKEIITPPLVSIEWYRATNEYIDIIIIFLKLQYLNKKCVKFSVPWPLSAGAVTYRAIESRAPHVFIAPTRLSEFDVNPTSQYIPSDKLQLWLNIYL